MRIGIKITLLLMLVVITAIAIATTFSSLAISKAFNTYFQHNQTVRSEELASSISDYYRKNGWAGIQNTLVPSNERRRGMGPGWGMGMRRQLNERIVITDKEGKVVADSIGQDIGRYFNEQGAASSTPIFFDNEHIGTLFVFSFAGALEDNFISTIKMANVKAGLAAIVLALVAGLYLSMRISRPLVMLSEATRRIAERELSHRVPITTNDEIGEVGGAFNKMAESLEKNEELRKNLIADVAHELRTPLAILRGNLEMLKENVTEPTPDVLVSLHEETIRISRLVEDLQSLSHADAGEVLLDRQVEDIAEIVKAVAQDLKPEAALKRIEITLETAEFTEVSIDRYRIGQVLYNLISNAIRYSEHGIIRIKVLAFPNEVRVVVQDNGPGIKKEHLPFIFDRFYRAEKSRNRGSGGSGLGLAIAKSFIEAHGGCIWAESIYGQGSTFIFSLPR